MSVSLEVFTQHTTSLGERLAYMEGRLNDIFQTVDTKMGEVNARLDALASNATDQSQKVQFLETARQTSEGTMDTMGKLNEEKHRAQKQDRDNTMGEMRHFVQLNNERFETMARVLNEEVSKIKTSMIEMSRSASSAPSDRTRSKLDPKTVRLDTFNGDRTDRRKFTKWRKSFEQYAEQHYPGIAQVLKEVRRCDKEVDESALAQLADTAGYDEFDSKWDLAKVDKDLGVFIEYKTDGDAQTTIEASELGGFDMYRLLNFEYDAVTENTRGALTTNLVLMSKHAAKSQRELKGLLRTLDKRVKDYKEKIGSAPDEALVSSVFTAILDAKSKDTLMAKEIYGNYKESRKHLSTRFVETHGDSDPMDVSALDQKPSVPSSDDDLSGEDEKPTSEEEDMSKYPRWVLDAIGKGGNKGGKAGKGSKGADVICHNCGGKGHFARNCTQPYNPNVPTRPNRPPTQNGGWHAKGGQDYNSKGKGKGPYNGWNTGKGGSAHSVTETYRSLGISMVIEKPQFVHKNSFQELAEVSEPTAAIDPIEYPLCSTEQPVTQTTRRMPRLKKSKINLRADWKNGNHLMCNESCCPPPMPPPAQASPVCDDTCCPPPVPPPAQAPPEVMYDPLLHPSAVYDVLNHQYVIYGEEPKDRPLHPGLQTLWKKFQEETMAGKGVASMLTERRREGINAVSGEEWREFTATIDSGASEHVVPPATADHIEL